MNYESMTLEELFILAENNLQAIAEGIAELKQSLNIK
jgi:hypothetical protein